MPTLQTISLTVGDKLRLDAPNSNDHVDIKLVAVQRMHREETAHFLLTHENPATLKPSERQIALSANGFYRITISGFVVAEFLAVAVSSRRLEATLALQAFSAFRKIEKPAEVTP